MDYLISLGSFPNYEITVWSWRNGDKLTSQETGMRGTHHIFSCSPYSPPVVAQTTVHSTAVILWEVHICFKNCLLTKLEFNIDSATPPCKFTWTPDGALIIISATGRIFMIDIEKRKLQYIFNWTGSCKNIIPDINWYEGGIVISGPDGDVKHFKRIGPTEWEISWSVSPENHFLALATCLGRDHIVGLSYK
ncbi:hypothetical protein L9F63_027343, partial [Diploptera punctata]